MPSGIAEGNNIRLKVSGYHEKEITIVMINGELIK